MKDKDKTKEQLLEELGKMRQRLRKLEAVKTKQKQTEQILKESEEKYKLLVETSNDMIFTVDLKGNFLFVNKAFKKVLGYSREDIKNINGFALVHLDDLPEVIKQFGGLIEGKKVDNMEYRYKTKKGSYIHILNNASPIFDSQGNVVAAFGIARDISLRKKTEEELEKAHDELEQRVEKRTAELVSINKKLEKEIEKRKRTEQALRKSEEKYRSIFESFQDVYYQTDREGRIKIISPSVYAQAGYNPKEMIGRPVTDFYLDPSDRDIFLQEIKKSGALNDYELKLKAKNGKKIDVSVSSRIIAGKKGKPEGVEGVLRNISERKKMEEELTRLSTAVKISVDGVIIADLDANIIDVNEAVLKKHGFKHKEEMVGKNSLQFVAPEDREKLLPAIKKMAQEGYIEGVEYRILTKDGRKIPVEANGVILRGDDGQPMGFVATVRDITERKKTEQELSIRDWAIKSSISAIALADLQGKLMYVNDSFLRLWDYGDEKEVIGKPAIEFWRAEDEALKVIEALHDKWNWIGELEAVKKDGSTFDAQLSASMVTDANGNPICMMASFIDITEHKRAEKVQTSLYKISEAAHSTKNLEEFYYSIHSIINELMPANNFYIALFDSSSKMLNFPYFVDEYEQNPGPQKFGKGLTEYVLRTEKPLLAFPKVFNDLRKKGEVISVGPPSIDWLGVPLKTADKTIGVLTVQSYTKGIRYGEKDKSILTFISEQVAMAIERKKIERELKESEEKFRNLAEQSPNMIFINKKGHVVYANKKCEEMMGYKREEFYSPDFDFLTLIAPGLREFVQKSFTRHTKGQESLPYEYALITKKGQRIEAILTSKLINYEGERAILGIVTDITQHKIAEEKYRSLYSAMTEGVCLNELVYDDKGKAVNYRITDVNPAYESITGLKKENIVGNKASLLYRSKNPPFLNIFAKVAETGKPASIETYFPPLKKYFIISAFSPEKGKFATVFTDITERYNTERELIEAKDQAETALKKLKRAQSQLIQSARLAALGKLSAGVAHEINNPLSIISGHTQILLMDKISDSPEIKEPLEIIKKQVDRASSITDQLLHFSKRIKPKLKKSDLNETLKDTLALLKQQLSQDKIKIVKQLSSMPVFIQADSLQLQQVFLNVIVNASHAMPNGGTLTINTMVKDANLEISFTDTGCGIPEEHLSKLFEPFFTTKENGTGLGLSIAYGIIKAHKGDIKVKSKVGKGTTFTIILPYE